MYLISDPELYTLALAERFTAEGGVVERADVSGLRPIENGLEVIADAARRADHAVVAAGAFSHRLVRTLGERISLETERGYNTTLLN